MVPNHLSHSAFQLGEDIWERWRREEPSGKGGLASTSRPTCSRSASSSSRVHACNAYVLPSRGKFYAKVEWVSHIFFSNDAWGTHTTSDDFVSVLHYKVCSVHAAASGGFGLGMGINNWRAWRKKFVGVGRWRFDFWNSILLKLDYANYFIT